MASDHPKQKIHPATDVEAPPRPTTPLISNRSSALEKVIPVLPGPIRIPATHQPRPVPLGIPARKSRSCWCKCLCWTIGLLVLIAVALGVAAAIIYFVFDPKLPNYSVDNLRITDLRLNFDMSLYARFDVRVTAENLNKKIGIYYKRGGKLSVWYEKTRLCEGLLPEFYQGHGNKTVLDVALTGQSRDGNALMLALQEQQQTGQVPLDLEVRAPVAVKLGRLKMRKVMVLGQCLLVVDSLSTNNLISIKASNCKFRLKL